MSRRQNPRLLTPSGTISIGGVQTGVQCLAGPSGWHLLGRPVRTYQLHRDPIFLLEPGDRVVFFACRRQDLCRAGPRCGGRRDRRRADAVMSRLVVASIGPASSVQDGGRPGSQRYGLTSGGAMDRMSLAAANTLVDNAALAAAIEIGPFGAAFTARDGAVRVALAGSPRNAESPAAASPSILGDAGRRRNADTRLCPRRFVLLSRDRGRHRRRVMFGSLAVNARAGLGSPYPRPLQAGDELQVKAASGAAECRIELPAPATARSAW